MFILIYIFLLAKFPILWMWSSSSREITSIQDSMWNSCWGICKSRSVCVSHMSWKFAACCAGSSRRSWRSMSVPSWLRRPLPKLLHSSASIRSLLSSRNIARSKNHPSLLPTCLFSLCAPIFSEMLLLPPPYFPILSSYVNVSLLSGLLIIKMLCILHHSIIVLRTALGSHMEPEIRCPIVVSG